MKIEEIKKDLAVLKEYNEKRQDINRQMFVANGHKAVWPGQLQVELNKQVWANDYVKVVEKYDKIFTENKVFLEPCESSPLEDFLTIAIALQE